MDKIVKCPTIQYHKIDDPTRDVKIRGAYMAPRRFARQMSYLKRNGFSFYTASEFVTYFAENGHFPERGICLTFDDGWKDNYTNAFPVIKALGIKATIFLIPSLIGTITDVATADGEGPREHLSEANIREMSAAGIEFGSHSLSHKLFDRIEEAEIAEEVVESKKYIENLLQKDCRVFAYPAGFYTPFAQSALKTVGYIGAFTTIYGPETQPDIYALNRSEILRRYGRPFQFPRRIRSIFPG